MSFLLLSELSASIQESFKTFMYSICSFVYELIIYLYDFFDLLCHGRIMENDIMREISSRIGLILGLVMFFRVVFSCIQYLINPDTINDKEKGAFNLVKNVLIVIVLLGTYSYAFDLAFKVQNVLLGDNEGNVNIISRLLLPQTVDTDNFGGVFSSNLFMSFYTMNDNLIPAEYRDTPEYKLCNGYRDYLENDIIMYKEFYLGYNCLTTDSTVTVISTTSGQQETVDLIDFNYILALVVGIFVCWALLMYCFSVGVRIIQLAFLEIIAPMPIISYLSPKKDGMFQKWLKMCTSAYLDVFIRVAIINFIVLIVANIVNGFENASGVFWESLMSYKGAAVVSESMVFLKIIIILALLQFAVKAPELLKELLPKSATSITGGFGFGLKDRNVLGKALATAGGVAAGGAVGFMTQRGLGHRMLGAALGVARGLGNGVSSKGEKLGDLGKTITDVSKKQYAYNSKNIGLRNDGSTFLGRMGQRVANYTGVESAAEKYENQINDLDRKIEERRSSISNDRAQQKSYQAVSDMKSKMESRAEKKLLTGTFSDAVRQGLQKELLDAKSLLETVQNSRTFSLASDGKTWIEDDDATWSQKISDAQINYNKTLKRTTEQYITESYANRSMDATMTGFIDTLNNVIQSDNSGAFASFDVDGADRIVNYSTLDSFEGRTSGLNNTVSMHISGVENDIQELSNRKEEITSSEDYKNSKADRNAVGGQKK